MRWLLLLTFFPAALMCQQHQAKTAEVVLLDEKLLTTAAKESSPNLRQIEATLETSKLLRDSIDDQYHWRLQTNADYQKSEEKKLAQFDSVVENASQLQAAVIKPFASGVQVGVSAFATQTSNTFIQDATNAGLGLNLSVDLMKNLFGRLSASQLKNAELLAKKAELEKDIQ